MRRIIFISAASGVGKSTTCEYIKDKHLLEDFNIFDIDDLENVNDYNQDTYSIFYENAIKKAISKSDDKNIIIASCINPNDLKNINVLDDTNIEMILITCDSEVLKSRLKARDEERNCSSDEFINEQINYQNYMIKNLNKYRYCIDNTYLSVDKVANKIADYIKININELMVKVNEWIKDILKDNYVGVYFHGSLRLGSFNPNRSDLDFIIVVKEKLSYEVKEMIWDKLLENESLFPKKGFEFSVVLEENCRNIKHPIAYELHGSEAWIDRYKKDKSLVINDDYKVDPDLASHFSVINVLKEDMDFGKSSKDVFEKVPKQIVIDSNYGDTLECVDEITNNPIYCTLNLCRFYALVKEDKILSKYDGGKWALDNMKSEYNDVIKYAMEDYISDTNYVYDNDRLKAFAKEAIAKINEVLKR